MYQRGNYQNILKTYYLLSQFHQHESNPSPAFCEWIQDSNLEATLAQSAQYFVQWAGNSQEIMITLNFRRSARESFLTFESELW